MRRSSISNFPKQVIEDALPENPSLAQEASNENTPTFRLTELAAISTNLKRLVAKNISAPPELLQELSYSCDHATRQNVAANPNTPTDVLLYLGGKFPEQLLNNPVFSLLWLENPNFLEQIPINILRTILKYESVPIVLLEKAANILDLDVRIALTMNPLTPKKVLEKLVTIPNSKVQEPAQLHVNIAGELGEDGYQGDLPGINSFNNLSVEEKKCAENLAKKGLIPKFLLSQLAKHRHKDIRSLVALNPQTPSELLKQLAQDCYGEVRKAVASNPNTPISFLKQLVNDKSYAVRQSAIENPHLPAKLLEKLASNQNYLVRESVASNPKTPTQLLEILARDDNYCVRRCAIENPSISLNLLEQLALDNTSLIRHKFIQNPNNIPFLQYLPHYQDNYRGYVALNPNIPIHLLEKLAQDRNSWVRQCVACNPNTPIYLLAQLAADKNNYVRGCVGYNPNTPDQLLEQLFKDQDHWVVESVANNSKQKIKFLLQNKLKPESQNSTPCLIRFLLFLHPRTPAKSLAENCRSSAWLERYAIARNSGTPLNILQILASDANCIVRATAKANLGNRSPIIANFRLAIPDLA